MVISLNALYYKTHTHTNTHTLLQRLQLHLFVIGHVSGYVLKELTVQAVTTQKAVYKSEHQYTAYYLQNYIRILSCL